MSTRYYLLLQPVHLPGSVNGRTYWRLRRDDGQIAFATDEQFEELKNQGRVQALIGGFETQFVCDLLNDCCRRNQNLLTEYHAVKYLKSYNRDLKEKEALQQAGHIFGALLAGGYITPVEPYGFSLTDKGVELVNATCRAVSELQRNARASEDKPATQL